MRRFQLELGFSHFRLLREMTRGSRILKMQKSKTVDTSVKTPEPAPTVSRALRRMKAPLEACDRALFDPVETRDRLRAALEPLCAVVREALLPALKGVAARTSKASLRHLDAEAAWGVKVEAKTSIRAALASIRSFRRILLGAESLHIGDGCLAINRALLELQLAKRHFPTNEIAARKPLLAGIRFLNIAARAALDCRATT
jgi:hypothetical protein